MLFSGKGLERLQQMLVKNRKPEDLKLSYTCKNVKFF